MNYYEILKISKTATDAEIKSSYKTLVKKYHPDLYVGDKSFAEQKIKEINEAYDILSDPERKAEYDEYLNPTKNVEDNYSAYNQSSQYNNNQQAYSQNQRKTQNHFTADSITWSISNFIFKKFDKLDKKHQLKIFIGIVVSILAIFLINLIQFKQYINNESNNNKDKENIKNEYSENKILDNFINNQTQDTTITNEENFNEEEENNNTAINEDDKLDEETYKLYKDFEETFLKYLFGTDYEEKLNEIYSEQ